MLRRLTIPAITVLLLTAFGVDASRAQGLGLAVGANFAELGDIDTGDRQATFENASGWHIHLWFDLPVGPVAVRPGLRYMDMGELFATESSDFITGEFGADEVVTMLEIPIDLRLRLGIPMITPYVMAGPVLRFPTGDENERFESFSLAGGAGVGLELGLGGMKLFPELKYTFGITRFTQDEYQLGNVTISPDDDQRLNAVMLSVGIGL